MDPDNPIVRLCVQGMTAEAEGRGDDARALFQRAWDTAADDYEACVAAHYLARHQPTPEETLRWNQECLDRADAVGDDRVRGFYASLHLNMGQAYRTLVARRPRPGNTSHWRPPASPTYPKGSTRTGPASPLRTGCARPARPRPEPPTARWQSWWPGCAPAPTSGRSA
ncbi:hypothetical protein AB4Z54_08470 [Streptomyces sp. MCAF7]